MIGSWITDRRYGMLQHGEQFEFAGRTTMRELGKTDNFFEKPVKNYGRFSETTRKVLYLTALALKDSGITGSREKLLDIGLLLVNDDGSAAANYDCFKDYVDGGRKLARSRLFIYTLPTSSVAEAAVHFGLQGPLLYLWSEENAVETLVKSAKAMIAEQQAERMLIYNLCKEWSWCVLVDSTDTHTSDYGELFLKMKAGLK